MIVRSLGDDIKSISGEETFFATPLTARFSAPV